MSRSRTSLLVTGASGQLGRRVVELLLEADRGPIVALTRRPDALADLAARGVEVRGADFEREAELVAAFRGAGRVLLVSTDALDRPGRRVAQHRAAIRALVAAGARHVVYTSLANPHPGSPVTIAPDHRETEAALADTSLDLTILRNNLYTDLLLATLPAAVASGKLVDARERGAAAFVTREDCARAAAAALAADTTGRRTVDVTGPAALTSVEVAAIAAEVAGRPVVHLSVAPEALVAGMVEHGVPRAVAELYASFDVAIARGELAAVTGAVGELTGRPPRSVRDFLVEHRAALLG